MSTADTFVPVFQGFAHLLELETRFEVWDFLQSLEAIANLLDRSVNILSTLGIATSESSLAE